MKCKKCEINEAIKYSKYTNGEFCSKKCSRGYSTKNKRELINKKISETLKGSGNDKIIKHCKMCKNEIILDYKYRDQECCSLKCAAELRWDAEDYRTNITNHIRKRCDSLEGRIRLAEIGKKGGFGKKGYTKEGVYFQSNIERECFEYLDEMLIEYNPHKYLPQSSKISDVFLEKLDIWIEIDGLYRVKRKDINKTFHEQWEDKMLIYEVNNLQLEVVHTFQQFKELINELYNI